MTSVYPVIWSLRPAQWSKNFIVFAGLIFARRLFDPKAVLLAVVAFVVFCALSGVVYLVNDICDRETDRLHPVKALRPISSGAVSVSTAASVAIVLTVAALVGAYIARPLFALTAAAYLVLQVSYSFGLKHIVIIDALTIAMGFVLRAVGGAVIIAVDISHWLLVCTILLALFIAFAKRRHELTLLTDGAVSHRPILGEYSAYLLDQMMGVVTASTLIAYIFYTISPETQAKFGTALLGLTIPFAIYGIFRYLYLVHQRHEGGSPTELLLTDRPLLACVAGWGITVVFIIYHLTL